MIPLQVDFNSLVQVDSWLQNASANSRNWNQIPLAGSGSVAHHQLIVDGGTQTVKLDGLTPTLNGSKYLLFELMHSGTSSFSTKYSILRLSDNHPEFAGDVTSVTTAGIPASFPVLNWLNPGYNFTITATADPLKLGDGTFCGTLTNNDEVTGTIKL